MSLIPETKISVFEIGMLICFGISWPVSIIKTLKTKCVKGKSVIFLYIIVTGYILGIFHKLLYNFNYVIYMYAFNALLVSADIILWYRFRNNE